MRKILSIIIAMVALAWPQIAQSQGSPVTGSITATSAQCIPSACVLYQLPGTGSTGTLTVQIDGTFSATLSFFATVDGTMVPIQGSPIGSSTAVTTTTSTGIWQFSAPGLTALEVLASAYASGTAVVNIQASLVPTGGGGGGGGGSGGDVNIHDSNGNPILNTDIVTVVGATTADTTNSPADCLVSSGVGTPGSSVPSGNCKASSGNLVGIEAISTSATLGYIKLYNLAASPTCSSATGFIRDVPILASATGSGVYLNYIFSPEAFSTGIGYCITGAAGSTDNSNAPAGLFITFRYK